MLNKDQIREGNMLIAQWLGGKHKVVDGKDMISFQHKIISVNSLRYNSSWNALMDIWTTIIEKSEKTEDDCKGKRYMLDRCEILRYSATLSIYVWSNKKWQTLNACHSAYPFEEGKESEDLKEAIWKCIVDFVKFLNKF